MPHHRIPSYRCYKPKNLGLVVIDSKQHYLGRYGSPESVAAYNRLIQEWLARGGASPAHSNPAGGPSINELILAFWTRYAERHYRRPDSTPTGELDNYRDSLRPLRRLYGTTLAVDFRPLALKAVRQAMIDAGLARTTINQRVGRIVRLFKWAVESELVPPAVHQALKAVRGLQKGRSGARETKPVKPVPDSDVDAVRPHVARQVWAMIELQRLTGMRPGEVVLMRTCDIDTSGTVWVYTPERHKTEHHGQERKVYLGPRAQEVVKPWLRTNLIEYLFSPREAMGEYRAYQRRKRKTPLYPSQRARAPKKPPKRVLGDHYTTRTYAHAIGYGCKRACITHWHPNQLRHTAATWLRKEFGLEAARVILGHRTSTVTEVYAEVDHEKALAIMERVG